MLVCDRCRDTATTNIVREWNLLRRRDDGHFETPNWTAELCQRCAEVLTDVLREFMSSDAPPVEGPKFDPGS